MQRKENMKRAKLIADTFINGKPVSVGSDPEKNILELDDAVASVLVSNYKAEYVVEELKEDTKKEVKKK
jgi:hypothetical protein